MVNVSVASASFYYWTKTLAGLHALEGAVSSLVDSKIPGIKGLEFHGTFAELSSWAANLEAGGNTLPSSMVGFNPGLSSKILNLPANSVHLPALSGEKSNAVAALINSVYESTGIQRFVVHPDEAGPTKLLAIAADLRPEVSISIENMDPRKNSFRSLEEVSALLNLHERFSVTLDICHWIENGNSSESEGLLQFLSLYNERVTGIHFSVPSSGDSVYRLHPEIETTHYLASGSNVNISDSFFGAIPLYATVVIEGVIPQRGLHLLERDISLLLSYEATESSRVRRYGTGM